MGKKKKFDAKDFEKQLKKAAQEAIQETLEEDVIPKIKKRLSKNVKESQFEPRSGVELATDPDAIDKYVATKRGIKKAFSSTANMENTPFVNRENSWNSTLYYTVPASEPIWSWNAQRSSSGNIVSDDSELVYDSDKLLAQWVVDGKLVIHPALSKYRGQILDGSDFNNLYFQVTDDNMTWKQYVKKYTFKQNPFVDRTIRELNKDKNFVNDIQTAISEKVSKKMK